MALGGGVGSEGWYLYKVKGEGGDGEIRQFFAFRLSSEVHLETTMVRLLLSVSQRQLPDLLPIPTGSAWLLPLRPAQLQANRLV